MKHDIKISKELNLQEFLLKNNLTESDFLNSKLEWEDLLKIGITHAENYNLLKETAVMLSSVLQQVDEVHSVRWRVKDPEHLMAKIIRKLNDNNQKYVGICAENYTSVVTDLIGIRVLHLFKKDWQPIHEFIKSMCKLSEKPVVYIRKGDDLESEEYNDEDCEVKIHNAGYRSAHYITTTRPMKDDIFTEIQVRTIFEEGWSEIDHRVRYPNFSDNELLNYFLMIFNRFSGSADEMGSFVLSLRETIELMEFSKGEILKIENEKAESLKKIDELILKLSSEQDKAGKASKELNELKKEMNILKNKDSAKLSTSLRRSHEELLSTTGIVKLSSTYESQLENLRKSIGHSLSWADHSLTETDLSSNKKLNSLLKSSNGKHHKMLLEALGTNNFINFLKSEGLNKIEDMKIESTDEIAKEKPGNLPIRDVNKKIDDQKEE